MEALRQMALDHPAAVDAARADLRSGALDDELLAMAEADAGPAAAAKAPARPAAKRVPPPKREPPKTVPPPPPPRVAVKPEPVPPVIATPPPVAMRPPAKVPTRVPTGRPIMVRRERGASTGPFIKVVRVSEDDDRYPEKAPLGSGLAVKVKDTDRSPLDADIELYRGRNRIARLKNLPTDCVVRLVDGFGEIVEIVVIDIHDSSETVTVGLRGARKR
jgi:hypothetical protein